MTNIYISPFLGPPGSNCKYETVMPLGKGSFGMTFSVQMTGSFEQYAAKIVRLEGLTETVKMRTRIETRCLQSVKHFGCIAFKDLFENDEVIIMIMELCDAGTLHYQISEYRKEGKSLEEEAVITVTLQLILALHYLHSQKILHRDLKSPNVLLTTNGLAKIGDFGLSNMYEDSISGDVGKTFCGTLEYIAPEIWRRERYGKAADMWALGVLLYETITGGALPFTGTVIEDLKRSVLTQQPPAINAPWNPELIRTVYMLLDKDPSARPTTRDLLLLPVFKTALNSLPLRLEHMDSLDIGLKRNIINTVEAVQQELSKEPISRHRVGYGRSYEGAVEKLKNGRYEPRYLAARDGNLYISRDQASIATARGSVALSAIQRAQLINYQGHVCFAILLDVGQWDLYRTPNANEWVNFLEKAT